MQVDWSCGYASCHHVIRVMLGLEPTAIRSVVSTFRFSSLVYLCKWDGCSIVHFVVGDSMPGWLVPPDML
jgi:hypothetical protein